MTTTSAREPSAGDAVGPLAGPSAQPTTPLTTLSTTTTGALTAVPVLSVTRLNLLRCGYLLMGVGLALVKWPLLPGVADLPFFAGVTLCILTAMSLLAFLGLRYPVTLLPLLLFESAWKLLWLSLVALPKAWRGDLDPVTVTNSINCSLVVVVLAVTPWRYVWRQYVRTPGDRWRR